MSFEHVVDRSRTVALAAAAMALQLCACEAERSAAPPPTDRVAEIRAACTELAQVSCATRSLCRSATFASHYGSIATCVERDAKLCERTQFGEGSTLTPDDVRACAAASDLSSKDPDERCEKFLRREASRNPPPECVSAGTLPDSAGCLVGGQCQVGACEPGILCGRCRESGDTGAKCFEDGDCAPKLACAAFRCVAYGERTGACDAAAPCHPDLACIEGACSKRVEEGDPCTPGSDECALWPDELACGPSGVCQRYAVGGANEQCGERDDGSVAMCAHGFVCRADYGTGPRSGVCVPVTDDRSPCSFAAYYDEQKQKFSHGGPCRAPAICFQARCLIPETAACSAGSPP